MLDPLIAGLLAGWGVAIPLGAIGVMVVDVGMRGGFRPAASAAAGVATADFLYAGVAAAAGAAVAGVLAPHERALRLVAAAVLAIVALIGVRMAYGARTEAAAPAVPAGGGVYARFLALTSINPTTVAYFAALIAGLPAVASAPAGAKVVFVVAAGIASLSWQLVLAGAGATLHHRLPSSARLYTALAGNAIVLALALRMALAA
jgi:threonine/homoserine/homoserine lactone efflux protein